MADIVSSHGPAGHSAPPAGEQPTTHADEISRLKARLLDRIAEECARHGWRRIALYGAGRHTRLHIRQPWAWHGVRVVAVLDDNGPGGPISGVPVLRPSELKSAVDAVIISSECYERPIAKRADAIFGPRGVPVLRIYGEEPGWEPDDAAVRRLVQVAGVGVDEARWLIANRGERHDATLPMLPPARTEMHLRRYDLGAAHAAGRRVLDAACGTGYGSALLADHGASRVIGIDIDAEAVAYARRRFARQGVEFRVGSADDTGLPDASIDLITSFETIEHVPDPARLLAEFARVLAPGGRLVMSTPNDWGLTDFHVHSFTPDQLRAIIEDRFAPLSWLGQRSGDTPALDGLPAGVFAMDSTPWEAETLIVIAEKRNPPPR